MMKNKLLFVLSFCCLLGKLFSTKSRSSSLHAIVPTSSAFRDRTFTYIFPFASGLTKYTVADESIPSGTPTVDAPPGVSKKSATTGIVLRTLSSIFQHSPVSSLIFPLQTMNCTWNWKNVSIRTVWARRNGRNYARKRRTSPSKPKWTVWWSWSSIRCTETKMYASHSVLSQIAPRTVLTRIFFSRFSFESWYQTLRMRWTRSDCYPWPIRTRWTLRPIYRSELK